MIDDFLYKSNGLTKFWLFAAGFQSFLFFIAAIITISSSDQNSILDFLTLIKGGRIALIGLLINLVIYGIDFYAGYSVHKESVSALQKNSTFKEVTVITKMKKYLEIVLVGLVLCLFMQMLLGILWWLVGIIVLVYKYFFYKNLQILKKY